MKLGQQAKIFIGTCITAMAIAYAAWIIADSYHGLFFDESFGKFEVNGFIPSAAGIFVALGWGCHLWMRKYGSDGSKITLKQNLIFLFPFVLILCVPLLFHVNLWNIFSSETEYVDLQPFAVGLMFFYVSGYTFSLFSSLYNAPQENDSK